MKAVVSEKGQVTIPKVLRERLGIKPGEELDFQEQEGRLVATKISHRDPVDAVYGILSLDVSTDEFIAELRGDLDQP
jgi:antitoxin PrlF